jgi:hypothetical protein
MATPTPSLPFKISAFLLSFQIWILFLLVLLENSDAQSSCEDFAPPAAFSGKKIFNSWSGEYLPVKGINYYPRPNEGELTDTNSIDYYTEQYRSIWERDLAEFQALRINAIRLYAVDPGQNHDAFMCACKAAGIYVIVGLAADCKNCAISWDPAPACYSPELKTRGEFIIQQFAKYENVLAFSAGNEVSLSATKHSMSNAPCQKKFVRDMRAYISRCSNSHSMRQIPVGIEMADIDRSIKAQYYNCRSDPEDELENVEYLGINAYLHCDGSATSIDQLHAYTILLSVVKAIGMSVPVMITEFGCLNPSFPTMYIYAAQRDFLQVDAIFSPAFRQEFNGGFVFEYSTEKIIAEPDSPYPFTSYGPGNWGVGYFEPENCDDISIPCNYVRFPQFGVLASKYVAVDTNLAAEAAGGVGEPTLEEYISPITNPPTCPSNVASPKDFTWEADSIDDLECPVEVPVYCLGVPGECVTVTLPPFPPVPTATATSQPSSSSRPPITNSSTFFPTEQMTPSPSIVGTTLRPTSKPTSTSPQPTVKPTTGTTDAEQQQVTENTTSSGSDNDEPIPTATEPPTLASAAPSLQEDDTLFHTTTFQPSAEYSYQPDDFLVPPIVSSASSCWLMTMMPNNNALIY